MDEDAEAPSEQRARIDRAGGGQRKSDSWHFQVRRIAGDIAVYASLAAVTVAVTSALGWGNPLVMAKDYGADKAAMDKRLNGIEEQIGSLSRVVLESQEIQLEGRLQTLDVEITKTPPGSELRALLVRQRSETGQALARVQAELARRLRDE